MTERTGAGQRRSAGSPQLSQALASFASGVTLVMIADGRDDIGTTVSAFCPVSLDPPLVSFCAAHSSTTWPHIKEAGHFCVNILGEEQEELSRLFAVTGGDKFGGVGWKSSDRTGAALA